MSGWGRAGWSAPTVVRPIESRRTAAALMSAYLLVVAFIVFWPSAGIASGSVGFLWSLLASVGLGWFPPSGVEFVTNVLLFVPLSFIGTTFRPQWRWRSWLVAGLVCTLTIETTQALFLSDRSAQLPDVISNTLGALLGYRLALFVRRR